MKKSSIIIASLLLTPFVISSCSTNKLATNGTDDNLYFMASDVELATQYAVENNNPQSFKNISEEPALAEQNFSSRNVNPEYISRYQATDNATTSEDGVVYFDEGSEEQTSTGNINAYDNYSTAGNGNGNGWNSPNINFNMGMGFGYSPFGWGMSPYMGFNYGMGFMPGLSIGIGFGFGYPMYPSFGWGYPMYPTYGWGYPMYPMYPGFGYPVYPGYPGYPSYILPGGEYGDRRVVYGARPTRGSSITNTGIRSAEAGVMPSTARAQARGNTAAVNSSARSLVSSGNTRGASRDFSSSQNDYYNSSKSRVATTRNTNSPATDRAVNTRSRSTFPSARPSVSNSAGDGIRNYASPSRGSNNPSINSRTSSPSYNRGTVPSYNRNSSPSYNNRSASPSYNRGTSPSNNRSVTPSRSNNNSSTFSAPSRTSTGGGSSFSTPSRSSGGSSGGSVGGSRGGRGN